MTFTFKSFSICCYAWYEAGTYYIVGNFFISSSSLIFFSAVSTVLLNTSTEYIISVFTISRITAWSLFLNVFFFFQIFQIYRKIAKNSKANIQLSFTYIHQLLTFCHICFNCVCTFHFAEPSHSCKLYNSLV